MANSIWDYLASETSNSTTGGWNTAEGQDPSSVNDGMRAHKQNVAAFLNDLGGIAVPAGTATAVAVTLSQGFTGYGNGAGQIDNGTIIALKMIADATGAATLNVNAIGTRKIRRKGDTAIAAGDWLNTGTYLFKYDTAYDAAAGAWELLNPEAGVSFLTNTEAAAGLLTNKSANAANLSAVRLRRNRLVNPAMQISSVNGNTSGTANGYVPADNWATFRVTSAGTITTQRVQSVTPKGAKDRIRVTITAADASLAAGEYLTVTQAILGQEVADFQYGGASAKQSVLRFLFKGPAGTGAARLINAAANRSYVALFTPAVANTDEIISLVIPGDVTGTWTTDGTTGLTLDIVLACGSTFQGTTGWQAGNIMGTSGVSNGMGTISQVFEIGEAGLYLDPDSTGVAPAWELPSYQQTYNYAEITPWVAYTPTITAFGTPTSVSAFSRRVGDTLEVMINFTPGTSTAAEARCSIGFNGTDGNVTIDSTKVPATRMAGTAIISNTAGSTPVVLMETGGLAYMVFGYTVAGTNPFTKQNGNVYAASGQTVSIIAKFPITGW